MIIPTRDNPPETIKQLAEQIIVQANFTRNHTIARHSDSLTNDEHTEYYWDGASYPSTLKMLTAILDHAAQKGVPLNSLYSAMAAFLMVSSETRDVFTVIKDQIQRAQPTL